MKKETSPIADFFKKVWLLIRCLLTSLSFCTLWAGIAMIKSPFGIYVLISSAIILAGCIWANIIVPIQRLPKKKK